MSSSYYRGSHAVLLVYDITDKESFVNVEKWLEETKKYANDNTLLILVGNKCDLEKERKVSIETGYEYAKAHNMIFAETSAKANNNVDKIFTKIATTLCETLPKTRKDSTLKRLEKEEYKLINCC
jgi:small GTP-binding protein